MQSMKEELIKLIDEFLKEIHRYNTTIKTSIDDEVEPTFESFIKWLKFNE